MTKFSEVTIDDIKQYANIFHDEDDNLISLILEASKAFVLSYTGLTVDVADTISDLPICVLVIANEMYDNRVFIVDNDKVNEVVKNILSMHSINFLGSYEVVDGT